MASEQSKLLLAYSPRVSDTSSKRPNDKAGRQKRDELVKTLAGGKSKKSHGVSGTGSHAQLHALKNNLDVIKSSATTSTGGGVAAFGADSLDENDVEIVSAALVKSAVGALSLTIDRVLEEALDVEEQLEWWRSVESSRWRTAYFLLQSAFPHSTASVSQSRTHLFHYFNL